MSYLYRRIVHDVLTGLAGRRGEHEELLRGHEPNATNDGALALEPQNNFSGFRLKTALKTVFFVLCPQKARERNRRHAAKFKGK